MSGSEQFGDALYYKSALDRGHMVRREDPIWGTVEEAETANVGTFHFTNSCPQMAEVNQVTWLGLEDHILQHAKTDKMRVSVFTGPFFSADDMEYRDAWIPAAWCHRDAAFGRYRYPVHRRRRCGPISL
jgi:endonuclease G